MMDPSESNRGLTLGAKYSLNPRNVVSSAYWKVPDSKSHLTSVACHGMEPFVAVASGSRDSNLFIYEVEPPRLDEEEHRFANAAPDDFSSFPVSKKSSNMRKYHKRAVSESATNATAGAFDFSSWPTSNDTPSTTHSQTQNGLVTESHSSPVLTHHQTISFSGIHSLAWVPTQHQKSGSYGNVLATGHNAGVVHLILLPDPYTNNGPAEIISRFNHTRHIPSHKQTLSTRIKTLNISQPAWNCCPKSSIVSMFSEHLFMWDPNRRDTPIIVQRTKRTRSFNISPIRNGIVSLATDKGISIMDMRYKQPVALAPPNDNDGFVSLVRWSSLDENRVASVHDQTTIKIWDIRTGSPLVTLEGHCDKINAIEWSSSLQSPDEFYSASSDGTVRLWDIKKCTDLNNEPTVPTVAPRNSHRRAKSEPDSTVNWLPSKSWRLYRQRLARENSVPSYNYFLDNQNPQSPCTTVFSNDKEFFGLATVNMYSRQQGTVPYLVSIDNGGFFGIHSKANQDVSGIDQENSVELDTRDFQTVSKEQYVQTPDSLDSFSGEEADLDTRMDKNSETSSTPSSPRSSPRRDSSELSPIGNVAPLCIPTAITTD